VALAGGVALYLFGIAFVDRVNEGVANGTALSARLGTAAFLLVLAVAGSPLPPLAFMTLVVVALLALTAFEAVSASP
jgi:low temperature requirement protein LtrA